MRIEGQITRWDDERGFGFISFHGEGTSVFVHISEFSGTLRRPEVGDIVFYEIAKGKNGKPRAEKVRFSDQPKPTMPPPGQRKIAVWPVISVCFFVCSIAAAAHFNRI